LFRSAAPEVYSLGAALFLMKNSDSMFDKYENE
jgi:hypothetical protein